MYDEYLCIMFRSSVSKTHLPQSVATSAKTPELRNWPHGFVSADTYMHRPNCCLSHSLAGWTLRNLAVNAENKVLIVEEGGLVPLIALLHSMNERAQEHAAGALRSLSVNAENQNLIVQNLGLPPLVALLHSQNAAVQEQAVVCIRNLSVNDENEVKIVQEGALPPLIKLLQSPVERIQVCLHICIHVRAWIWNQRMCSTLIKKSNDYDDQPPEKLWRGR
jgi:hypothetical protein